MEWRQVFGTCGSYAGNVLRNCFKKNWNFKHPEIQAHAISLEARHSKGGWLPSFASITNKIIDYIVFTCFSKSKALSAKCLCFCVGRAPPGVASAAWQTIACTYLKYVSCAAGSYLATCPFSPDCICRGSPPPTRGIFNVQAGGRVVVLRGHCPAVRLETVSRLTEVRTAGFGGCLENNIAFHYMNGSLQRKSLSLFPESL